tara:strand:- start:309 stop:692 length:384 start_codon:yes stop_codon:yes gene_type:complete
MYENEVQQKFDHDLQFGKLGEDFVKNFQSKNNKVEVKTERDIWKTTGNIAIEMTCRGKRSGISVTEAETWIHLLSYKNVIEGGLILKTKDLKDEIKRRKANGTLKTTMGGDDNVSWMALLPIKELFV